jgi:regulator of PEP synthase PpsR (kinase-PPPase family)
MPRTIFFISDGTGITVENLGNSLLSQFEQTDFLKHSIPYVNDQKIALDTVARINNTCESSGQQALIFTTLVNPEIQKIIEASRGIVLDLFNVFIGPLEHILGTKSSYSIGKYHSTANVEAYKTRIDAVNYALAHDDGVGIRNYSEAEIILFGVSRSGKTPTCLYLALQFGIKAANYPYTAEDMQTDQLPAALTQYKNKLFGLLINPERLHSIRSERRRDSEYAALATCQRELKQLQDLFTHNAIPYLDATDLSIEELATKMITLMRITKRV